MKKSQNFTHKKLLGIICLFTAAGLLFTACAKKEDSLADDEMTSFHDNMASCYESIASSASALDAIDPSSDTAVSDMFTQLDQINAAFQDMAALDVPEEYSSIESMADDAAYYMNEASRLYKEAYSGEEYQSDIGATAKSQYTAAMTYLSYIGDILKGEIPEGDNVTVTVIH